MLPTGKEPFTEWIRRLKDRTSRARILVKIDRLAMGNESNIRHLKGGISELKLTFGVGFRVYFAFDGPSLIVLLAGGDKSTQSEDIEKAQEYWHEYKKGKRS